MPAIARISLILVVSQLAMTQEPTLVNPPLTEAEHAACEAIRSAGGGVYFHPESSELVMEVYFNKPTIHDEQLELMEPLAERIDWVALNDSKVSSDGLIHVAELSRLHSLLLHNTAVDDQGLEHLTGLKKLKYLRLDGTRITGANLSALMNCSALSELVVGRTPVGLSELRVLQNHPSLDRVDLFRSQEARESPEWEHFWRNLPFVKARAVKLDAQRKQAEEQKKKHGALPFEMVVEVVKWGDDGKQAVVYRTDIEADDRKGADD